MAEYNYSEPIGGVFSTDLFEVRYLLGDTAPSAPFSLSDAEIEYEISQASTPRVAAANVAYKMSNLYGRESVTSKSVGDTSISRNYASVAGHYRVLALKLRSNADRGAVAGVLWTGPTEPEFTLGKHDNNG